AVERRRKEHPVEVPARTAALVVPRVDPPWAPQQRAARPDRPPPVERPRQDRVVDHPREVSLAVMVIAPQVHLTRREPLEAERAANPPQRIQSSQQVKGHRTLFGTKSGNLGTLARSVTTARLPTSGALHRRQWH